MIDSVGRIKEIMKDKSMTSKELALRIGVQPSTLSHYFTGRNSPSISVLNKVLAAFPEINPDWLFRGGVPKYIMSVTEKAPESLFVSDMQAASGVAEADVSTLKSQTRNTDSKSVNDNNNVSGFSKPQSLDKEQVYGSSVREIVKQLPSKIITRIVVYYSDNTYEDFLAR